MIPTVRINVDRMIGSKWIPWPLLIFRVLRWELLVFLVNPPTSKEREEEYSTGEFGKDIYTGFWTTGFRRDTREVTDLKDLRTG
jgi:hypothetical protein